jgi:DNA polymerase-3 subunit epsilon
LIASPSAARLRAISWAKRIVNDPDVIYLDTETTGLGPDAEIVDIAAVDQKGRAVLDTLICPLRTIPIEASKVHGITERDVHKAPMWADHYLRIAQVLRGKTLVIYNGSYDTQMIRQVCVGHKLADPICGWQCAMLAYADFIGEASIKHRDGERFRWWSLSDACAHFGIAPGNHRALADAEACRLVVHAMAEADL